VKRYLVDFLGRIGLFQRKRSLIGIESGVEEVLKLLDIGVEEGGGVRFIGIHGMGGVGKTTLANFIYDMVSPQFEIRGFISCKERHDIYRYNRRIDRVQNQLISQIMGEEIKYNRMDERARISVISRILRHKRVFLVLDDVDSEEQIEALAWSPDLFGEGSRIILTSRDAHLLSRHATASAIYEVKLLNDNEALQLFCLHAFKRPYPPENYEKVSRKFVTYAQGLPFALKLLGSEMFRKDFYHYENRLERLQKVTSSYIDEHLKRGFSRLDDVEKELFLDIACFFKESDLVSITHKLESFGYFPNTSIATLKDNSLITISRGRLSMHNLIEKMGKEIVRCESRNIPGERSRLWHWEDVLHVLDKNEVSGLEYT
jgi:hypothetical protein